MANPSKKGNANLITRLTVLWLLVINGDAFRCDWGYEGHSVQTTSFSGRFGLNLSAETYIANANYTVTLYGKQSEVKTENFLGFLIAAEADSGGSDENGPSDKNKAGSFQKESGDSLTKFSEKCENAVTHTNFLPKTEIQVFWKAPATGSGCVTIKATVMEHKNIWYTDDLALNKVICENPEDSMKLQPIIGPCCACPEAKYEVTFEGLWSRHTHPKDFPVNEWSTKFSDIIGASHSDSYRFWDYNHLASDGLRQLVENGITNVLESELKNESTNIRTIIKARGISYPNLTGKTFAVFRVTSHHHLMSLVSRINPSPDWIVGISGLELCLPNCTWIDSLIWNLYPWDIGIDSGVTYESKADPTDPRDVIRRIGPNDPDSPFYDKSGREMKPLARLNITRQRLYEKHCENNGTGEYDPCALNNWFPWSPCSLTCGKGKKTRQRYYVNSVLAEAHKCNKNLSEQKDCYVRKYCRIPSEYEPDPAQREGPCAMTEWSTWSSCSSKCTRGSRTRSRKFRHKGAFKKCHQGYRTRPPLQQTIPCFGDSEDCPDIDVFSSSHNDEEEDNKDCPYGPWSEWSTCTTTCGQGTKTRTRELLSGPESFRVIDKNNMKKNKQGRWKSMVTDAESDEETDNIGVNEGGNDENYEDCKNLIQTVECDSHVSCEISSSVANKICSLPKTVGPCRGYIERWFFDLSSKTCEPFGYTGCQGNRNNFKTYQECMRVCRIFKEDLLRIESILEEDSNEDDLPNASSKTFYDISVQDEASNSVYDNNGLKSYSQTLVNFDTINNGDDTGSIYDLDTRPHHPKHHHKRPSHQLYKQPDVQDEGTPINDEEGSVDCRVSSWSKWSHCSVTCGVGYKFRHREILQDAANGGRSCPDLLAKERCRLSSCEDDGENSNDVDCILSEWSSWSPCTETCGPRAVKQRTRRIIQAPSGQGYRCGIRLDSVSCRLMPCPLH